MMGDLCTAEWDDDTDKAITIFRMSCGFDSTL